MHAHVDLLLHRYLVGRALVPFYEELVFRGFLWSAVEALLPARNRFVSVATVLSAFVFGLMHWQVIYGFPATLTGLLPVFSAMAAGLIFGALRDRTDSIWPGVGTHMIGNALDF